MDVIVFVMGVGVLVFASHFFAWLFNYTAIPNGLLLMLIGVIVGPLFDVVSPDFFGQAGQFVVTAVLVVLLFEGGLQLHWSALRSAWKTTLRLSVASFILTMIAVAFLGWWLLSLSVPTAAVLGAIVGGVSSAIVIPLLQQLELGEEAEAVLFLESVVSDVLAIVITISLVGAYVSGSFDGSAIIQNILLSFVGATVLGGVSGFLWSRALGIVRHMQNSIFATPAFVFVLFGLVEQIGMSGPIAALAFGVVLGNMGQLKSYLERRRPFLYFLLMPTPPSGRERSFFEEVVFLMQTFFFVYVGLSLSFSYFWVQLTAVLMVCVMLVIRPLVVRATIPRQTSPEAAAIMSIMVPKGLAAAALAAVPAQAGMPGGMAVQDVTYAIVLWSVLFTSLLVFATHKTSVKDWYEKFFALFGGRVDPLYPKRKDVL